MSTLRSRRGRNPSCSPVARGSVPGPSAIGFCTSAGPQDCDATLNLSNGQRLKYYRSYPLDQLRLTVTRVVLAVHGLGRNAQGTYANLVGAATAADVLRETLIVAPLFGEDTGTRGGRQATAQTTTSAPSPRRTCCSWP